MPLWFRLWTGCQSEVRVHDRVLNQILRFTPEGAPLPSIELPPPPFTEATPRQFASSIFALRAAEIAGTTSERFTEADSTNLMRTMIQQVQGDPARLGAYLPRYVDIRCGEDGKTWLRPLDLDRGNLQGGATWLSVQVDGPVQSVTFPPGFEPYRFQDGYAWGVQLDELGVASIARGVVR